MPNDNEQSKVEAKISLTPLFVIGGAILGVVIVVELILDPIEQMGWSLFWQGLFNGGSLDINEVLNSTTFWKCLAGLIGGGIISGMIYRNIIKRIK